MRVLALLVLLTLAAPLAAAARLQGPTAHDGSALFPGATSDFSVVTENETERNATRVILRQCVGEPNAIRFCYTDINMTKAPYGTWTATRRLDGATAGESLGSNVTMHLPDGSRVYIPHGGDYVFQKIGSPPQASLPLLLAAGALLFAALGRRAR